MKRKRSKLSVLFTFGDTLTATVDINRQREITRRVKGLKFTKFSCPGNYYTAAMRKFPDADDKDKYYARFVVTATGKLWLSFSGRINGYTPHHNDMALNEKQELDNIIAAGKLHFNTSGEIDKIDNSSGHFEPSRDTLKWIILVLHSMQNLAGFSMANEIAISEVEHQTTDVCAALGELNATYNFTTIVDDSSKQQIIAINENAEDVSIDTRDKIKRNTGYKGKNLFGVANEDQASKPGVKSFPATTKKT